MITNQKFADLPDEFWAHIKLLSEDLGYSERLTGKIKVYTELEIKESLEQKGLETSHLYTDKAKNETYMNLIREYCEYRSKVLSEVVEPNLMNRDQAKSLFDELFASINPKSKMPLNKQKGEKKHQAYLTGIVTMLTEHNLEGKGFVEDPRSLTLATKNNIPIRTFNRRFDGIYPSIVNPTAVWEIKEYYGTTTFGSRVADGVYETLLDGYEFKDLKKAYGQTIKHYLIIDDHFTWWTKGKSYLCRMIDMQHMGYVDEIIFGKEIVKEWPRIVKSWTTK